MRAAPSAFPSNSNLRTLELFAGAGGLGLGMAKAGISNAGVVEWNNYACETIRANLSAGHPLVSDWKIHQEDARQFPFRDFRGRADLVSGGPPCQPFSMGGKHQAYLDPRDMFPQAIRAIREIQP
jgi:DNA (cytosine-5)-methyltransferase 1